MRLCGTCLHGITVIDGGCLLLMLWEFQPAGIVCSYAQCGLNALSASITQGDSR